MAAAAAAQSASKSHRWQELRQRIAAADALPVEVKFLYGPGPDLSVPKLQALIKDEQFELSIDQLHQESLADPLAQEVDASYRQEIARQLAGHDAGLSIDRFACGLRICLGSMRGTENSDSWSRWSNAFDLDPATPHRVFADFTRRDDAGGLIYRFLFSTDNDTDGFRIPIHP